MPILVNADDPTEYMEAMAAVMIVGTTVGTDSVFFEKGIGFLTGTTFPVVIVNCPETTTDDMTMTASYQSKFRIMVGYLDRWESSARTFEELLADAKTALYQMARNIRATPGLGLTLASGQANIVQAALHTRITIDHAAVDIGAGFPVVNGTLEVDVTGPYFF